MAEVQQLQVQLAKLSSADGRVVSSALSTVDPPAMPTLDDAEPGHPKHRDRLDTLSAQIVRQIGPGLHACHGTGRAPARSSCES